MITPDASIQGSSGISWCRQPGRRRRPRRSMRADRDARRATHSIAPEREKAGTATTRRRACSRCRSRLERGAPDDEASGARRDDAPEQRARRRDRLRALQPSPSSASPRWGSSPSSTRPRCVTGFIRMPGREDDSERAPWRPAHSFLPLLREQPAGSRRCRAQASRRSAGGADRERCSARRLDRHHAFGPQ